MLTALYYPHTRFENEQLVKTALVLFDEVEWIAPDEYFRPQYKNPICADAMDVIGRRYVPSDEEKKLVHEEVVRLVSKPLPDWFVFRPTNENLRYQIFPRKFSEDTWKLLLKANFVDKAKNPAPEYKSGSVYDYETSPALGLTLMGILADVCAGTAKRSLTDEEDGYAALIRHFTEEGGFEFTEPSQPNPEFETYEHLIAVSYKTVNSDELPFERLIEIRKEEEVKKNDVLKIARRAYFEKLDHYAKRMTTEAKLPADKIQIEKEFCEEMEGKLVDLKKELKVEASKALLSKEMMGVVLAAAGALIEPVTSSVISAGLLTKQLIEYRTKRHEKIKANPTGWLYMQKPLQIF
jgi:hypothetical protein